MKTLKHSLLKIAACSQQSAGLEVAAHDALTSGLKIAACNYEILMDGDNSSRIQLLPYGEFKPNDGRQLDVPAWYLTEENGFDVARIANGSPNQLVLDYEHQTLMKEKNGQPNPAAGWMKWFEFSIKGLFAEAVWTDKAAEMIRSKEYRYISAVFAYDTKGYVRKIYHAALTNTPALDGMDEILAAASAQFLPTQSPEEKEKPMLAELLRKAFGTPEASEDDLQAALSALIAKKPDTVALSAVFDELDTKDQKIAALSAQQPGEPDPAKYVPIDVMQSMQAQIAALSAQSNQAQVDNLIESALKDGKLLPAQKGWAQDLVKSGGVAALSQYLEKAMPIAALTQTQAPSKPVEKVAALNAEQARVAKNMNMTTEQMIAALGQKQ